MLIRNYSLGMDVVNEESIKNGVKSVSEVDGKIFLLTSKHPYILIRSTAEHLSKYSAGNTVPPGEADFATKKFGYHAEGKIPYELESFEGWHSIFRLNTFAPFLVTSAFLDLLEKGARFRIDGTSSVINISGGCATLKSILPYNSVRLSILPIVNGRG